jgi:uncharacterized damage-inducible protein DinB
MTVGISLEELLAWNEQSAGYWNSHFEANPALLELPCDIGGVETVQGFVRHIWGAELRWCQRLAGGTVTEREKLPAGPLDALFDLHGQATAIFRKLMAAPEQTWSEPFILDFDWVPAEQRAVSRRKIAVHMLLHSQRHWAQLATLVRSAGFPSKFRGDLLFSPAMS